MLVGGVWKYLRCDEWEKKNAFIGKFGSQHPEFRYFGVIFGNICLSYRNYTIYII